ncbi:MAG: ATP-binding protein [Paracoccaceae bacterium]|nr:ATP-binding protein [Paracoccaceae bacterium]MDG1371567.1 ATP-binding protein [Paracoccaceae bacterium]
MAGGVDLEACDDEPIHFIGAVQPHGALIAVSETEKTIDFASVNTHEFIGVAHEDLLGKSIASLIGKDVAAQLLKLPTDQHGPELLRPWFIDVFDMSGAPIAVECLPHRNGGHIILEFHGAEVAPAPVWEEEVLRQRIIAELVKPDVLLELADASARIIRDVTGFDRVMIYRFAEDNHGEVIAESTNRPDSFLGLHYPASDIPNPARRHFALNVMRSIPDINGGHIPIVSRSGEGVDETATQPLDLTFAKLRAVAKVHVEYLKNMGVGGSLSISLITNNKLWGLVACHHYSTRLVSSSRLRFAELLGTTTSALLQSIENTSQLQRSITAEKAAYLIEQQARNGASLADLIVDHADLMMGLIDAHGMVFIRGDEIITAGAVPDRQLDFRQLLTHLEGGVMTSAQLSSALELDEAEVEIAAGVALLDLSDDGRDFLVFLRSEYEQTISWAGKPTKLTSETEDGVVRLSPRGSFALWREERRGQSRPFDSLDRDAMRILRRSLFALNSIENEQAALEAQKKAETEERRLRHSLLEAARASSMGELAAAISHELNQPLSAVANYVNACSQELLNSGIETSAIAQRHMERAVAETARAGDLVKRIRNFISQGDLKTDLIDLNEVVKRGLDLAHAGREDAQKLVVTFNQDPASPEIMADEVQLAQVVLNLVSNSLTAMAGRKGQRLTVDVLHTAEAVQVAVRDNGPGIAPEHRERLFDPFHTSTTQGMGIGLSLCKSIIEAHSGKIWLDNSDEGAVFVFQLPSRQR